MNNQPTDMQRRFVLEYTSNGGNATQAAKDAGYSQKSAHEIGRQLLEKTHIQHLVLRELNRLQHRSGVIGLNALVKIAQDDNAPANARVSAARALCEHADLLGGGKSNATSIDPIISGIKPSQILALFAQTDIKSEVIDV